MLYPSARSRPMYCVLNTVTNVVRHLTSIARYAARLHKH